MSLEKAQEIFAQLDPPLWLLTAQADNRRGGLIASFVAQASITPKYPRVLVGIAKQHNTWELIEKSKHFALHLLGEQHIEWIWHFGLRSGRNDDKLEEFETSLVSKSCPRLVNALAWMACRVESKMDAGDRTIYLAEILDADISFQAPLLTTNQMIEMASEEQKRELKDKRERDQAIDSAAIEAWRKGR